MSSPLPSDELFQNYPAGLLYFATAACICFILVGIPGNLITIIALAKCKKVSARLILRSALIKYRFFQCTFFSSIFIFVANKFVGRGIFETQNCVNNHRVSHDVTSRWLIRHLWMFYFPTKASPFQAVRRVFSAGVSPLACCNPSHALAIRHN